MIYIVFYISTEALSFTFMNIYQYLILHKGRRKLYSEYMHNRGGNRIINIEQPEQATMPSIFGAASRSQSFRLPKGQNVEAITIIISFIMVATTIIYRKSPGAILSIILYGLHVK